MSPSRLWAPWRAPYITHLDRRPLRGCLFCRARRAGTARGVASSSESRRATHDRRHWVVHRGRRAFVLLNLYPYNNGHLLIAPLRHVATLAELTEAEILELWRLAARFIQRLDRQLAPHGYNVGLNLGRPAGAGVLGHLHLHIVPRWDGDTNFMSVTAGTKVISMSLDQLYRLLV